MSVVERFRLQYPSTGGSFSKSVFSGMVQGTWGGRPEMGLGYVRTWGVDVRRRDDMSSVGVPFVVSLIPAHVRVRLLIGNSAIRWIVRRWNDGSMTTATAREAAISGQGKSVDLQRKKSKVSLRKLDEQPEWLKGGKLRDYQLEGLNFLVNRGPFLSPMSPHRL
ncbi:protein CHROMATIN REMODELING 5 isoform X1 [Cucumis melo var. makuwa]|uniref:Protein CHROMATIN REMODELING 5 isoform X1 n=1 Tax=Cucumis melo var. makuwa TaxID=1194695 RepID=A0A5A7STC6_CUCMM|nr:protein CHROMATIN REMODELING 5 isoform X1 [Cucumis melo var. makuwa]